MFKKIINYLLDIPIIYKVSQVILAPGANKRIINEIEKILKILPLSKNILDVGCGPESWLWKVGLQPVGLDLSAKYIDCFNKRSANKGIIGSADEMPIEKDSFDSVWSFGLFHHLPDNIVKSSIKEMVRVCKDSSHIVIIDAVLPRSFFKRPMAWIIRKADRGRYMRTEIELLKLTNNDYKIISKKRITYSYIGLEALSIIIQKQ